MPFDRVLTNSSIPLQETLSSRSHKAIMALGCEWAHTEPRLGIVRGLVRCVNPARKRLIGSVKGNKKGLRRDLSGRVSEDVMMALLATDKSYLNPLESSDTTPNQHT